jgi:tRNA1Val (adenine37-N6)-methyltransferase
VAFAGDDLTSDAFLGGRLTVRQPRAGYRAGVDPVLLAAAVPARAGESVLELGCGAGVAALCLGRRVPGVRLTGLEIQPDYAALARENAEANGIPLEVVEGDLARMPADLRARSFDQVIANPPYYRREAGTQAADGGRETALGEATPLASWVDAGLRRLRPGGRFTLIQRADRLPDLLAAFAGRRASLAVLPLAPREGREATLLILAARKDGRAPFRLLPPVVLHEGRVHLRDGDDYAPAVRAVLRDGAALPVWPG